MYVVMRVFNDFQVPAIIFKDEERAIQYVKEQETVFCSYRIKFVEYWEEQERTTRLEK